MTLLIVLFCLFVDSSVSALSPSTWLTHYYSICFSSSRSCDFFVLLILTPVPSALPLPLPPCVAPLHVRTCLYLLLVFLGSYPRFPTVWNQPTMNIQLCLHLLKILVSPIAII
ncbi:hypothetical protein V8D89_013218 [Ganoderma adspersum]